MPGFRPTAARRERRNVAHVDADADHRAALAYGRERRRHQRVDRRADHPGVGATGARSFGRRPRDAELARERCAVCVIGRVNAIISRPAKRCDLRDDMRGRAEAVEAEPRAVAPPCAARGSRSGRRTGAARVDVVVASWKRRSSSRRVGVTACPAKPPFAPRTDEPRLRRQRMSSARAMRWRIAPHRATEPASASVAGRSAVDVRPALRPRRAPRPAAVDARPASAARSTIDALRPVRRAQACTRAICR